MRLLICYLIFFSSCHCQSQTQPRLIANKGGDLSANGSHNVHCGMMDKRGNLWFGTTGDGLYRYDGTSFTHYATAQGLSDHCVWSVLEDTSGAIWLGTNTGACRYDGTTFTIIPVMSPSNSVYSILQDRNGLLWFGTAEGVYCYDGRSMWPFLATGKVINKQGLHLKSVGCMLEDQSGTIWFGSGMGGREAVCRYDGTSLVSYQPTADVWIPFVSEDKAGSIWFSGRSHGNFRYDGTSFTDFTEQPGFSLSLQDNARDCFMTNAGVGPVYEERSGAIWYGGANRGSGGDAGIWRYDGITCTNFASKDGLGNSNIWCVVEDSAGNIWVGTGNTGLYRFDGKVFTCFSE